MSRLSLSSLRSRAIILVLLAILPLLALTLHSYFERRDRAIREVQRDELVAARNLATVLETLITSTRHLLETVAQLPEVQRRDRDACNALLARLMEQNPHYTIIAAADPEGWSFASAPATTGPVSYADRLWFRKTIQTRTFFVGEPLLGRVSRKYLFNLACPIQDDRGRLQGVVAAGVNLQWLGTLLIKSDFPPSTALVLTDGTGRILFRYPEPLKYIGREGPEIFVKAMTSQDEGVLETVGLPGDMRLIVFTRLSPPWQDLRISIGLPKDWALARVNRDLQQNLTWLGLVGLLAAAAAWYGSDLFIVQPVRKLRAFSERLAEGDLTVRIGPDYPAGELGLLAHAFDQMGDSLQAREIELKKVAAELHNRVEELDRRTAELEATNKEMESFSYTVAHDLRAPLRAIGGFSRILLEESADKLDAEGIRHLNIIQSDIKKMGNLIDDLLTLSRLARREMRFTSLEMEHLVRSVLTQLQAREPERHLQVHIQPLPPGFGDRDMVRMVLENLLDNALKFTRPKEGAVIEVSGEARKEENVYCVRDNGVGFEMEYAAKLFEVFQRLHPQDEFEGTGMGLAIVQRIMQRHGGRVWAEGKVGEGAKFCFSLPKEDLKAKVDEQGESGHES